ncbi:MAG: methionine aminotransferase [Saprospiraceae bacterium]
MNQGDFSEIASKLPQFGTSIFARMTELANRHQAVNLAQGFPDFSPPSELIDALADAARNGHNQYAPMPGVLKLREQLAERIYRQYQYQLEPGSQITVTAGATQAIYTVISTFTKPGDKVIIFEPAYDSYAPSVLVNGGVPIYLRLQEPLFSIPWNQLEDTLKSGDIRMMIINNPHNPSATVLSADDMMKLVKMVRQYNTVIIWDEVYDLLTFDQLIHQSALLYEEIMEQSIVVYSLGKTLHNTGWKLGYIVARSELTTEIRKLHQFTVFSVHTPSQYAVAAFMSEYPEFFDGLAGFYQEKRDQFYTLVSGCGLQWLNTKGSYFMLAGFRHLGSISDMEAAQRLTELCGVACVPISAFYHDHYDSGILRFCFAKKKETLAEAAFRLKQIHQHNIFNK